MLRMTSGFIVLPENLYITVTETAVNEIRQVYYLSGMRAAFRKTRKGSMWCKVYKVVPDTPRMATVPTARITPITVHLRRSRLLRAASNQTESSGDENMTLHVFDRECNPPGVGVLLVYGIMQNGGMMVHSAEVATVRNLQRSSN